VHLLEVFLLGRARVLELPRQLILTGPLGQLQERFPAGVIGEFGDEDGLQRME
jgi:hypothetical protein